ncbi:unnamed protein product [Tuber aestivum]|uniref:RNase H type-1 domain-containing protein n=1 Tax=Tuber aestivum TaxID=59557 RepID=A0A292PZ43_9PEZI|nr:unnamed protein product [Tuber aestivum]
MHVAPQHVEERITARDVARKQKDLDILATRETTEIEYNRSNMLNSRFLKEFSIPGVRCSRGYATNRRPFPKVPPMPVLSLPQSPSKSPGRAQPSCPQNSPPPPPSILITALKLQHLREEGLNEILLYADACCCRLTGASSAGIYSRGVEFISISLRLPPGLTSVQAETEALLRAIAIGLPVAGRTGRGIVTVCGDCRPALDAVKGWIDEGRFGGVGAKVRVRVEWVKGHNGVKGNVEADRLARRG